MTTKVNIKSNGFSVKKKEASPLSLEERQMIALESIATSLEKLVSFHEEVLKEAASIEEVFNNLN